MAADEELFAGAVVAAVQRLVGGARVGGQGLGSPSGTSCHRCKGRCGVADRHTQQCVFVCALLDEGSAGAGPVGRQAAERGQYVKGEQGLAGLGNDTEVQFMHGVSGALGLQGRPLREVVPTDETALGVHAPTDSAYPGAVGDWQESVGQALREVPGRDTVEPARGVRGAVLGAADVRG